MKISKKMLKLIDDCFQDAANKVAINYAPECANSPDEWGNEGKRIWDISYGVAYEGMKILEEKLKQK